MIKEYTVIWANNLAIFTEKVNQAIKNDWEPWGHLVVVKDPYDSGGHIFYQAIIKKFNKNG